MHLLSICKDTPDATALAAEKLKRMDPVTKNEWIIIGTMIIAVSLWVFGDATGVSSVVAAMLGLSILLLGVLDWDDSLNENSAWDTLAWFAVLVEMAEQLTNHGIISRMSSRVANLLESFSLSRSAAFCALEAFYFLIHYLFASPRPTSTSSSTLLPSLSGCWKALPEVPRRGSALEPQLRQAPNASRS